MFPPVLLFSLGLGTFMPRACLSGDSEPHIQGWPSLPCGTWTWAVPRGASGESKFLHHSSRDGGGGTPS